MSTFFWYDYETFGTSPKFDRISQFAGIRTDQDLNILETVKPVYCLQSPDYIPHPEACLITGITPQEVNKKGICEAEFANQIAKHFEHPNTCVAGYNSIRFDDEMTRYLFYRNFIDPYAREYASGNSRWDIIDMVRTCYALRPDGITWPKKDDGSPSFKLEELTVANGIEHGQAHDALADVYATIAIAKIIKQKQPKLYDYLLSHKQKNKILPMLNCYNPEPFVHISSKIPAKQACCTVMLPLCPHPTNKNSVIAYDLGHDPKELLELTAEQITARLFVKTEDLAEGKSRIHLKEVHANKCPVVLPLKILRPQDLERININLDQYLKHFTTLTQDLKLKEKLHNIYSKNHFEPETDPDHMLYSGAFFKPNDRKLMNRIRVHQSAQQLSQQPTGFQDTRLPEMLFRYRARNYPKSLTTEEQQKWQQFCIAQISTEHNHKLSFKVFKQKIVALEKIHQKDPQKLQFLNALTDYVEEISTLYSVPA